MKEVNNRAQPKRRGKNKPAPENEKPEIKPTEQK